MVGGIPGIPPITALDGDGSQGLGLRQTYTVTMVTKQGATPLGVYQTLFAVPSNVGPRTMPNYTALQAQGFYNLPGGISVFAGTVADPFFIDLGAAFDSLNFRMAAGGGVLKPTIDADDHNNYAPNTLAGFNVNSIVLEVPITMLTVDGLMHAATRQECGDRHLWDHFAQERWLCCAAVMIAGMVDGRRFSARAIRLSMS